MRGFPHHYDLPLDKHGALSRWNPWLTELQPESIYRNEPGVGAPTRRRLLFFSLC
jgi:hypothetical protein